MAAKPLLFISHSSDDTAVAPAVANALADGFTIFLDAADIKLGDAWQDQIEEAIADCDAAVVLLSQAVAARPFWVSNEAYALSLRKRRFTPSLLLVPVLLHPYSVAELEFPSTPTGD